MKAFQEKDSGDGQKRRRVVDMNKSYESMGSNEEEAPHYNYDSDGEPPTDQVGDKLTIIKRQQVTKKILKVGENTVGKPGKPYIVTVSLLGYFAKTREEVPTAQVDEGEDAIKTKEVTDTHI